MNMFKSMRVQALLGLLLVVLVGGGVGASVVMAGDSEEFEAVSVTGVNRLFGQPILEFPFMPDGSPLKEMFGFDMLGVYNPGGPDPFPLTASSPDSAVLASFVDPAGTGPPPPVFLTVDPQLLNVPLRDIETYTTPALGRTGNIPFNSVGPAFGPSQAEPNGDITKGDWLNASGKMKVKCSSEENSVRINMKGLVPNRLYTVWALWLDPDPDAAAKFVPSPLGGAPNAFITDKKGRATFEREVNFCPTDAAKDGVNGKRLAVIDAHIHSDHAVYGAVPAPIAPGAVLPPVTGFAPGTVIQAQLEWNLGAGVPADD